MRNLVARVEKLERAIGGDDPPCVIFRSGDGQRGYRWLARPVEVLREHGETNESLLQRAKDAAAPVGGIIALLALDNE